MKGAGPLPPKLQQGAIYAVYGRTCDDLVSPLGVIVWAAASFHTIAQSTEQMHGYPSLPPQIDNFGTALAVHKGQYALADGFLD